MRATVWPVTDAFVAEIGDVDLSNPLSDADFRVVDDAFERYAVLIFPDQVLSQDQHIDFARRFGPIDRSMIVEVEGAKPRVPGEIADVSNLDNKGEILAPDNRLRQFQLGNQLWHTDSAFKHVPAKASLLYQRSIAQTGEFPRAPVARTNVRRVCARAINVKRACARATRALELVRTAVRSAQPTVRTYGECAPVRSASGFGRLVCDVQRARARGRAALDRCTARGHDAGVQGVAAHAGGSSPQISFSMRLYSSRFGSNSLHFSLRRPTRAKTASRSLG